MAEGTTNDCEFFAMRDLMPEGRPVLVLAPMQDVTDLPFMRVMARHGGADVYVTEYFRVHAHSKPDAWIMRSVDENPTGRPVFAQMIGQDVDDLVRVAKLLLQHPVAGVDLNLGCPAPVVCKKDAGGGLLRNPAKVDTILGALRDAIPGRFTVKTRVGYHSHEEFPGLLEIFRKHGIDSLAIHGRTVVERYQTPVHPECVRMAKEVMKCPVIANGNVVDVATGLAYLEKSGADGLMIGRGAIRNPFLFEQLRRETQDWKTSDARLEERQKAERRDASRTDGGGTPEPRGDTEDWKAPDARLEVEGGAEALKRERLEPTCRDLLGYVRMLYEELAGTTRHFDELGHVQRMKKTMVFVSQGLGEEFEFRIRRAKTPEDFHSACADRLENDELVPVSPGVGSRLFCGFEELVGSGAA
jgi:tRNA-dihydrouridine synthase C